ncbi:MAG: hypothetical protein AB7S48_06400 [Bacteroidales bacterium]
MNKIFYVLIFSILYGFTSFAQQYNNPTYYLDSVRIDIKKHFFNHQNVEKVNTKKETPSGEVYITSKEKVEFLSLSDVLKKYANINKMSDNVVIKINNKRFDNISDIKIDRSFYIYVQTDSLAKTDYLNEKFKDLIIVNIDLESKERKPQVLIRGIEDLKSIQSPKKQIEE